MSQRRTHGNPVIHELKCDPGEFEDVKDRAKPYEVRINDRPDGFHAEDYIWLREFSPEYGYTLDCCMCRITHVLLGPCPEHGAALYEKSTTGARLSDAEEECGCYIDKPFPGVAPGYAALGIRVLS